MDKSTQTTPNSSPRELYEEIENAMQMEESSSSITVNLSEEEEEENIEITSPFELNSPKNLTL